MPINRLRVACLQLTPGTDVAANIVQVRTLAEQAVADGANVVATPEYVAALDSSSRGMRAHAMPEAEHRALSAFRSLARDLNIWFLAGSLTVTTDSEKIANRSYLIDPHGGICATYDKLHMFDVSLADGRTFRESRTYRAGDDAVVAETPFGRVGLTICYDIRFPHLYRAIAKEGARLIFVPASFHETGRDVWHVLLRSRAIETSAYIVAPATCGTHSANGRTLGHSLIVDPRGTILADGGREPGVIVADIDLERSDQLRAALPSLQHDRPFGMRVGTGRSEPPPPDPSCSKT